MLFFKAIRNKYIIGLSVFVCLVLFIISQDSYTHDLFEHTDSACFFMCGKAWMNGMIPYVDFADSKGPLLWLIYGVGYLLSPHNYIGVFWISCLWYAIIYYYTFRTANIFLKDYRKSFLCAILMTLAYFNSWIFNETRAEDFANLFMIISLYHTSKLLYSERITHHDTFKACFILGFCFSSLLLIKFNIAAMQCIFILTTGYFLLKNNRFHIKHLIYFTIGVLAVLLPFFIYFFYKGNFNNFIQEYIINTLSTVSYQENLIITYIGEWLHVILKPFATALLIIGCLGSGLLGTTLKKYKYFPFIVFIYIFSLTIRHAIYNYYYNICSFTIIFLFIYLLIIKNTIKLYQLSIISCFILGYITCSNLLSETTYNIYDNLFWKNNKNREHYYKMGYLLSQVNKASITYYQLLDIGIGTPSNSLPAGKYWMLQNGATQQMRDEHLQIIINQKTDFIYFSNIDLLELEKPSKDKYHLTQSLLDSLGYKECYRYGGDENGDNASALWTNKEVQLPPKDFHVSNWDVLLKRNIFKKEY